MNALWMDAPRRGNKHTARGRAQRHLGNNTIVRTCPERAKALIIKYLQFMYCMFFYAFALAGRGVSMFDSRGAAALCPGLCACCPVGARSVRTI